MWIDSAVFTGACTRWLFMGYERRPLVTVSDFSIVLLWSRFDIWRTEPVSMLLTAPDCRALRRWVGFMTIPLVHAPSMT